MRTAQQAAERSSAVRLAAGYNAIPNFLWSILHLGPVAFYCFTGMPPRWAYIFLGASILPGLAPNSFFDWLQLGSTTRIYKKIGIAFIRRYSQDGDLINRRIQRRFPGYKVIEHEASLKKYIQRTYIFGRFHFMLLLFFLCVTIYAAAHGHGWWALLIGVNNLLYNLYPIWLQEYNRIRLLMIATRRQRAAP